MKGDCKFLYSEPFESTPFAKSSDELLGWLSMKDRVVKNGNRRRIITKVGALYLTPIWESTFDIFLVEVESGTEYKRSEHIHPGNEYIFTLEGEMDMATEAGYVNIYLGGSVCIILGGVVHWVTAYRGNVKQVVILDPPDPAFRDLVNGT